MVDLPQPELPTIAVFLPGYILILKFLRIILFLDGYLKVTFLNYIKPLTYVFAIFLDFCYYCIYYYVFWSSKLNILTAAILQFYKLGSHYVVIPNNTEV
jgi:hypothetical protein